MIAYPLDWMEIFVNNYEVDDMNLEQVPLEEAVKIHEEILSK